MHVRSYLSLRRSIVAAAGAVLASSVLASAPPARAVDITSSGPLTLVQTTPDLNCNVHHVADVDGEFYSDTACATLVATGGVLYGPADIPAGDSAGPRTTFTEVSQTGPTGAGTAEDPFTIVTVVDLGTSGLRLTQTDTYVNGADDYATAVNLSNTTNAPVDATIYRAGDCYLANDDSGYGHVDGGAVQCVSAEAPGRLIEWTPTTAGSHYYQAGYNQVWALIGDQLPFPDTCRCAADIDNGAGLSWTVTLGAASSADVAHRTRFTHPDPVAQCQGLPVTITGSGTINGTAGDDVIVGSAGVDTINGRGGDDTICAGAGDDKILQGTAADGADAVDGEDGTDTISYASRTAVVRVTLNDTFANDGASGEADELLHVENATGGTAADVLTGSGQPNVLIGGNGNDTLNGLGGDDNEQGGNDNDTFVQGASANGADVLNGQAGTDTASYGTRTAAVTVTLGTSATGNDGAAGEADNLKLVENATGGSGNDSLTGNAGANVIAGGNGNDVLRLRDNTSGNDTGDGGAGTDTAYADAGDIVTNVP